MLGSIKALNASALPTHSRSSWGPPKITTFASGCQQLQPKQHNNYDRKRKYYQQQTLRQNTNQFRGWKAKQNEGNVNTKSSLLTQIIIKTGEISPVFAF